MNKNKIKSYQYIFFDLDGTLTDSAEGITNAVKYALEKNGVSVKSRQELLKFIGPPLTDSFIKYYGYTKEEALKLVKDYREYFSETGLFENKVYDGIPDLLERLRTQKKKLIIATSKPEEYTNRILDYFDLTKYFDFVAGATMDATRIKKADVIRHAMHHMEIADATQIIMVGDRHHDVDGAKINQIDSIGVLYGFGSKEELQKAGATYIVQSVEELAVMLV